METGNTSVKMRNMGQAILDTLLRSKGINKSQYQKLVKKYFRVYYNGKRNHIKYM